ncbi:MAG TPA: sigma-70 family RNA polymerase sigma factor, partial [Acidimicrobiales bacterium]|nr:sigma-70 family RNA polymerase sigma factor [Acidimicrobiales bacterium]
LAVRVLGDRGRAADVTQVVFSSLWEQADRYDPERGTLRSYLLTMAHRRAVDTLRADGRRKEREGRIGSLAEAPYDLEREVSDMAVGARVRAALGGLPTEQRQAIEMAYFAGHTYREVAVILGEAEGTVKSRIRYGLQHLRSALLDVGVDD